MIRRWIVSEGRHWTLPGNWGGLAYGGETARAARMYFWRRHQRRRGGRP